MQSGCIIAIAVHAFDDVVSHGSAPSLSRIFGMLPYLIALWTHAWSASSACTRKSGFRLNPQAAIRQVSRFTATGLSVVEGEYSDDGLVEDILGVHGYEWRDADGFRIQRCVTPTLKASIPNGGSLSASPGV